MNKRIFDFILAFCSLVALAPLFLVLGCIIKLNDHGPAFFTQWRVGLGGKLFRLYKFRTMKFVVGSENGLFEPGDTSRVTSVGKFLRRTKLDELPQLLNVLRGDMSLVGPRPEVEKWVAYYPEKWQKILTVRPGITDNASLEFCNEEGLLSASTIPEYTYLNDVLPRKLELCMSYVDNRSFAGDMRIILHTLKIILFK